MYYGSRSQRIPSGRGQHDAQGRKAEHEEPLLASFRRLQNRGLTHLGAEVAAQYEDDYLCRVCQNVIPVRLQVTLPEPNCVLRRKLSESGTSVSRQENRKVCRA